MILDYLGELHGITDSEKWEREKRRSEAWDVRCDKDSVHCCWLWRGSTEDTKRKCRWLLHTGKGNGLSPRAFRKEHSPAPTFIVARMRPTLNFNLLSLWWFFYSSNRKTNTTWYCVWTTKPISHFLNSRKFLPKGSQGVHKEGPVLASKSLCPFPQVCPHTVGMGMTSNKGNVMTCLRIQSMFHRELKLPPLCSYSNSRKLLHY